MQRLLRHLGPHTHDDRGVRVPLWSPWSLHREALPPHLRDRLRYSLLQKAGNPLFGILFSITPIAILLATFNSSFVIVWVIIVAIVITALHAASYHSTWQTMANEVRDSLLAAAHCPSCGYDLRSTPPDQHGYTICSECCAAWSLPATIEQRHTEIGDQPQWRRGRFAQFIETAGFGFLLPRGSCSALDDRGRIVEIVYPFPRQRPAACWNEIPPDTRQQLENEIYTIGRPRRYLMALVAGAMVCLTTWFVFSHPAPTFGVVIAQALIAVVWLLVALSGFVYAQGSSRSKVIDTLLAHQRCASCAADLASLRPNSKGITDCPRCRAAWAGVPRPRPAPTQPARTAARPRTIAYNPPRD